MQLDALDKLHGRIKRIFQNSAHRFQVFDSERQISFGYETRRKEDRYYWNGAKHAASTNQPQVIFQYAFEGRGEYADCQKMWPIGPGQAFTSMLPGAYRYYLPEDSEKWTFIWFIVKHPFVCGRIKTLLLEEAPVQTWSAHSAAIASVVNLFEGFCMGKGRDVWDFEEKLFAWLLETERELYWHRYPKNERQQLLDETRQLLLEHMAEPPSVERLADLRQMERTTFSRKFKAATGIAPAAFLMEVRLEQAIKLLRTDAKLERVAAETGFANANHFCKVFRHYFHTSPGHYRKLFS